jgi:Flp pilus assembly CpaE family ATPase
VWITKDHGSPGATMLAANLLVVSGRAVLVELDPGTVAAAYLDADQDRALHVVVKTAPSTPEAWDQVLAAEVQPVAGTDEAGLLAGTSRLEERAQLTPLVVASLLDALRQRYDLVLVDLGLFGAEASLVEVVQAAADRILLVGSADVVGLHQTRAALEVLGDDERVDVVLTRYDRRRQYPLATITAQLRREPLAVIPYDYLACARAVDEGRPVALDGRSQAGQALRELAERLRTRPAVEDGRKAEGRPSPPRGPMAARLLAWWRQRVARPTAPTPPSRPKASPPESEASMQLEMPEPTTVAEAGAMVRVRPARRARRRRIS